MASGSGPWSAAWAALRAGQPAEAERVCRSALAADPGNAEGWFLLGLACHYQRRSAEAADCYTRALRIRPDMIDAHNNLGSALREQGRAAEAENCFRQALRLKPDFAEGMINLATALQDGGRLHEATDWFEQALRLRPDIPEAHNNLGNALRDLGRLADAEQHLRRALELRPAYAEAHNNLGNVLRQTGRLSEAEACFRQALRLLPDVPAFHNNLGTTLRDQRRLDEAEACFRQALRLRPDFPESHNNLGTVQQDQGKFEEAADCFRRALRLRPGYAEAHNNLGIAQRDLERLTEAEVCFRQAIRLRPDYPEAFNNLGTTLRGLQRSDEAEAVLRQALQLRPRFAEALLNLGNALQDLGRLDEALDCYHQALQLRPDFPEAHNNIGGALRDLKRPLEAAANYEKALKLRPNYPEAHNNWGIVLRDLGRLSEAEASYARALELRPNYPEAVLNQGNVLLDQGRVEHAEAAFRRALDLRPGYLVAHDALLLTMHYRPTATPAGLAAAHADYDRRVAAPLRSDWRPYTNDRNPERPSRLGLVSPDFGRHPVGFLSVRAVEALARRPGALVLYSDRLAPPDDRTARFRAAAGVWRDTAGQSDAALAEQVRADAIDVLIDLAGHTGSNRLLTFARKPAPVQVTWLGYEGTTGLEAMDYLIADERMVPAGSEVHHRERVLRLPSGYVCYDPFPDAPVPGPLPAAATGRVTFACFNNPAKLSDPALAAFAAVLNRVPGSRLLLKYRGLDDAPSSARLRARLTAAGIDPARVELLGLTSHLDYLAAYREVDVALDPFPFAGGVTTCDALWMGVPVVTLPQHTFASRHGLSYLTSAGLADEGLVARDVDDYVARAVGLVGDLDRLAKLRSGLRERMGHSPLCDGDRVADELLAALRGAWRKWASGGG
jgi:predicted O-linked N-acetylglucosamine transferase (SPINDLY family)